MQIPPHQEPQPASIPPAQANNEAATSGSNSISTTPSQQSPTLSTNVDQNRFPVKARGISLYALWDSRHPVERAPIETLKDIGIRMRPYGLWTVGRFIWKPREADGPAMTAAEVEHIIISLQDRLKELYAVNPPMYLIFHIKELITPKRPFPRLFSKKRKTSEEFVIDSKEGFLEKYIQPLCDLGAGYVDKDNDWVPNRFRHYDQISQKKGWLVISPTRALFADVDEEQVITLASLLQPYYTDSNRGPGILSERYYDMLVLIMQWVSNQDSLEAVDRLKKLVTSGTQAIDGQVWLNFAVAGIGILIAFLLLPNQNHSDQLIASMVCLALASPMFWGYARFGKRVFLYIGWLVALAIVPCLFAWTQVVSIYDAVIKFLPHL